jgi:3-deoxy-D-manno-octulosonate 8-phosphate phosphatase (KDO 8-P phosphatase)
VKRISARLRSKAKNIVLLLLDVDGVLTDGRIIVDDRGVETKHFHVRDGQGIALLLRGGIEVGFMTARSSASVRHRARDLGVRLLRQGVRDKLAAYESIRQRRRLNDAQIAFMGDDIVDLPVLRRAGVALSVADGWEGVRAAADFVTAARGGDGAVREVAELLLKSQGQWSGLIAEIAAR